MEHPENVSEIDQNWNLGQITGFTTFYPNLPQLTRIIYHENRELPRSTAIAKYSFLNRKLGNERIELRDWPKC